MNHQEDRDHFENDNSDHLIINDDDDSEDEEPILETLVLKKELSGYTIEKNRKIKKEQPLDQEKLFSILPLVKTQPLTQEELSSLYMKYVDPFFTPLKNIVLPQQSEAATSSDNKSDKETEAEINLEFLLPDEEKVPSIQQFKFLEGENLEFQGDLEDTKQHYHLNSEFMDQSLGGCGQFIIKDCFLGEKNRNLSELDGFQFKNSKLLENCIVQFEEPILERLFSQVSDISQASTITANAESDEWEFLDPEKENTQTPKRQTLSGEKLNILEDGIIPVISKSDSDVYIIGPS